MKVLVFQEENSKKIPMRRVKAKMMIVLLRGDIEGEHLLDQKLKESRPEKKVGVEVVAKKHKLMVEDNKGKKSIIKKEVGKMITIL